jgi:hypothetical protein
MIAIVLCCQSKYCSTLHGLQREIRRSCVSFGREQLQYAQAPFSAITRFTPPKIAYSTIVLNERKLSPLDIRLASHHLTVGPGEIMSSSIIILDTILYLLESWLAILALFASAIFVYPRDLVPLPSGGTPSTIRPIPRAPLTVNATKQRIEVISLLHGDDTTGILYRQHHVESTTLLAFLHLRTQNTLNIYRHPNFTSLGPPPSHLHDTNAHFNMHSHNESALQITVEPCKITQHLYHYMAHQLNRASSLFSSDPSIISLDILQRSRGSVRRGKFNKI